MPTWGQALAYGLSELGQTAKVDVLRLLTDHTEKNLLAVYDILDLSYPDFSEFQKKISRCKQGEPVAYITNRQDFWQSSFYVDTNVLIPRQDSELLVEHLLTLKPATVLELGVGSGAVILSYLLENKAATGFASDLSMGALSVARRNSEQLACPLTLKHGSWFAPWASDKFAAIVANPPYIAANDPNLAALSHEPRSALVAADAGLADLKAIIAEAMHYLEPGGWLLLEHGFEQAKALATELLAWPLVYCLADINGRPRVTVAQAPLI